MANSKLLVIANISIFILLCLTLYTGFEEESVRLHTLLAIAFSIAMLAHLALNWRWIASVPKMLKGSS